MKRVFSELTLPAGKDERALLPLVERRLRAPCKYMRILKKSLDARDKSNIRWVYAVECSAHEEPPAPPPVYERVKSAPRVYIAGAGPAGLFCALRLLEHGIRPVVIERGKRVEERAADVMQFRRTGVLDPSSNVQFGEGGAGTFSDGKLTTQTNSPYRAEILHTFVRFGAPPEVEYLGKPHIGSDNLPRIVAAMRAHILREGGEVRFGAALTDVAFRGGRLASVAVNGVYEEADELVLAVGHSARDTFSMLLSRGFVMEPKEFAVGVRIEHLQSHVSLAQYGGAARLLPPADYKLVSHAHERAVFTFCMCPGGVVIPAASEAEGTVTNGMSSYARDGVNANSALVAQVRRADFAGDDPLAGVRFQQKLEHAAYLAAGGGYRAPVQLVGDFLAGRESSRLGSVVPSYVRGIAFAPLEAYLPRGITEAFRLALPDLDARLAGFASPEATLTGVESRTSSPVRIVRGEDLQAAGKAGVYPCGEGCGYAGGIASAAADGIRVAATLARKYF